MRQVEHDEALHRLANEHCRHTTRSTDGLFLLLIIPHACIYLFIYVFLL